MNTGRVVEGFNFAIVDIRSEIEPARFHTGGSITTHTAIAAQTSGGRRRTMLLLASNYNSVRRIYYYAAHNYQLITPRWKRVSGSA